MRNAFRMHLEPHEVPFNFRRLVIARIGVENTHVAMLRTIV